MHNMILEHSELHALGENAYSFKSFISGNLVVRSHFRSHGDLGWPSVLQGTLQSNHLARAQIKHDFL
jgi:hypothetical protein